MTPTRPLEVYQSYFVVIGLLMLVSFIIFGHGVYSRYKQWKKVKDKAGQCAKPLDNVSPWKISWKSRADWDDEL